VFEVAHSAANTRSGSQPPKTRQGNFTRWARQTHSLRWFLYPPWQVKY